MQPLAKTPVGRFAPSPTGELHLGSLTTAVASFCHIKSLGGRWLVRIEDTDFERCKPAFGDHILNTLDALGLHWDAAVYYQSQHNKQYEDYLYQLAPLIYPCCCSRKALAIKDNPIYPKICTPNPSTPVAFDIHQSTDKIRLQLPDINYVFQDGLQGTQWQNPQRLLGDIVLRRNNGMFNYVLACAIDDSIQQITHVMRGIDILPMTAAQYFIRHSLKLSHPDYFYHLPLVINHQGQKLSKQNLAKPINTKHPSLTLYTALTLLGQNPPKVLAYEPPATLLEYAITHWDNRPLQYQTAFTRTAE